MRQIKLLCASIAFVICTLSSFAQIVKVDDYDFKSYVDKLEFSNLPNYVKWNVPTPLMEYRCSRESIHIYCDFQRTDDAVTDYTDSYFFSKYRIPLTKDLLIGVMHIDGEYSSRQLLIVDKTDYTIKNSLYVAHESSAGPSMQHTVTEVRNGHFPKLIVTVYTFIPKPSKSVDIVDFRFTPNAIIWGNIRKEEYEVGFDFKLISTKLSLDVAIRSSDLTLDTQLWTLYDQAVGDESKPNPPIDDKPGPTPPREER